MNYYLNDEKFIDVILPDRIDSGNFDKIQKELETLCGKNPDKTLRLNAESLEYISSAGLRVLLMLQKKQVLNSIINVSADVYNIFEMTGFAGALNIIRNAEEHVISNDTILGKDSYGLLYKLDDESVLRIYNENIPQEEVLRGIELSKRLIQSDVSMAITYDTVKTEEGFGCKYAVDGFDTIFSYLRKKSKKRDEVIKEFVNELLKFRRCEDDISGMLERSSDRYLKILDEKLDYNEKETEDIRKAINLLTRYSKVIFGDINEQTIIYTNKMPTFLDLSLLRYGNIVFELAGIYRNALVYNTLFGAKDDEIKDVWHKLLKVYLNLNDEQMIEKYAYAAEAFAALLGLSGEFTDDEADIKLKLSDIVDERFISNGEYLRSILEDIKAYQDSENKNNDEKLVIDIRERKATRLFKKVTLLKDINMTIYPGEMVLLLGGSGAGKTTFLNAVTGYEKADATITKGNIDLYKDYENVKHRIAFAPQQDLLRNEDSVYNTLKNAAQMRLPVETSAEEKEKEIERMLDIFGLTEMKDSFIRTLSGGQRKRASIAVEFISDPMLFFLDEPDSGLDGVMAKSLMEDLRKITGDSKIIVVISHAPDRVIELFDKVIILAKSASDGAGHLAFYGSPKEAREFFGKETMEGILKLVNKVNEGGEGRADEFIEKFKEWK